MARTLTERIEDAIGINPHLHPVQEAITWGTYYVTPAGAKDDNDLAYGVIPSWEAFVEAAKTEALDVEGESVLPQAELLATVHLFPSVMYGVMFPQGTNYLIHASTVWPIERETFRAARRAGFEVPVLSAGHRANLLIACTAWRAHTSINYGVHQ